MINKRLKKYIINEYRNSDILENLLYFIPKGNSITIVDRDKNISSEEIEEFGRSLISEVYEHISTMNNSADTLSKELGIPNNDSSVCIYEYSIDEYGDINAFGTTIAKDSLNNTTTLVFNADNKLKQIIDLCKNSNGKFIIVNNSDNYDIMNDLLNNDDIPIDILNYYIKLVKYNDKVVIETIGEFNSYCQNYVNNIITLNVETNSYDVLETLSMRSKNFILYNVTTQDRIKFYDFLHTIISNIK